MKEKPYVMKEKAEQVLLASWCRQNGIIFVHIANEIDFPCPNDGVRFGILTNRKKAGVSTGFPDNIICLKGKYLFIELKRTVGGVVSKEQTAWLKQLNSMPNTEAMVCKGVREAVKCIKERL